MTVKLDYDKDTWDVLERERELRELALTAGADIIGEEICHRSHPAPDAYIGTGKAAEIAELARTHRADLVIFNNDLSGTQHKNLEKTLETRVVDRTQLILDIFARRARSPEGKAQVELAQLEYRLPRLSGRGTELSRLGGGIGTRGPGEQKLEEDRRRIRDRVIKLKNDLKDLHYRRQTLRQRRQDYSLPTVVLVGYTSAGKSTLFNALTGSHQPVRRGLFTTLDPLSRAIPLPNRQKIILFDTVGFIRNLPHHLVEAFKATLEEVVEADLLIHVLDIASPGAPERFEAVRAVLKELGAFEKKIVTALNKTDLLGEKVLLERFCRDYSESVPVSALTQKNLEALLFKVQGFLSQFSREVELLLPSSRMDLVNLVYAEGKVLEISYGLKEIDLRALLPAVTAEKLRAFRIGKGRS